MAKWRWRGEVAMLSEVRMVKLSEVAAPPERPPSVPAASPGRGVLRPSANPCRRPCCRGRWQRGRWQRPARPSPCRRRSRRRCANPALVVKHTHSQFAASSVRKALADLDTQAFAWLPGAFVAQLADSTRNSQRIELADIQLAREPLQGTRTPRTPTRNEFGPASPIRNT